MWSGIFGLFIKTTTLTSLRKAIWERERWRIPVIQAAVIFLTADHKSKGSKASFQVSHFIFKHKKSFQDRELVKEAFVEGADSLFRDFKNNPEIFNQSSPAITKYGYTALWGHGRGVNPATLEGYRGLRVFFTAMNESTNMSDTAQLGIFIRMVFTDTTAKEELLTVLPMKEHTQG